MSLPTAPYCLDEEGHTIERFIERYKPWKDAGWSWQTLTVRVRKFLISELPGAVYVMTEDDGKQSIWRTPMGLQLTVDMDGVVRTVLPPDTRLRSYRPIK